MDGLQQSLSETVGDLSAASDGENPELLSRVLDLFMLSEDRRSASDTEAFGTVLERLAYAADVNTRAELAGKLSLVEDAPRHLMRHLAFDDIIVARPVLQYSSCLSGKDLVTLAEKLGQDHLLAIAHRLHLTANVTDVLVERGGPFVHVIVAQNSSADFSKMAVARLVEAAEGNPDLKFILSLRADLSPGLFARFKNFVKDQMFIEDEQKKDLAQPQTTEKAAAAASKSGLSDHDGDNGKELPVHDPVRDSYACERNLMKLARGRLVQETVNCLAKLTNLDTHVVEHCLFETELSALMVLCKAHGFSNATFTELMKLRDSTKEDEGADKTDIVAMLKRYESMQSHTAKRIIQFANKKK